MVRRGRRLPSRPASLPPGLPIPRPWGVPPLLSPPRLYPSCWPPALAPQRSSRTARTSAVASGSRVPSGVAYIRGCAHLLSWPPAAPTGGVLHSRCNVALCQPQRCSSPPLLAAGLHGLPSPLARSPPSIHLQPCPLPGTRSLSHKASLHGSPRVPYSRH